MRVLQVPLSQAMVTAWRAFAGRGEPGVEAQPWPPHAKDSAWMVFGGAGGDATLRSGLKEAPCALWDSVEEKLNLQPTTLTLAQQTAAARGRYEWQLALAGDHAGD